MSFLENFKDATIGFSGYPRLLRSRTGGFGYLALLLLIVMTISGAIATYNSQRYLSQAVGRLEAGPNFGVTNGEVRFSGEMPYAINLDEGSVIIIDTTGKTTPEALHAYGPRSMLITRNVLYQMEGVGQVRSTDLRSMPFSISKADIIAFVKAFHWIVAIGYVLLYAVQLGCKALDACILGLIAMAYASSQKRPITFDLGFKAGLYAMSIPILIQWLYPGFSSVTLIGFATFWGISILYIVMGLKAYLDEPPGVPDM